jgi:hypothetical protein
MQPDIPKTIFEKVKSLPPDSQKEVLKFVDKLQISRTSSGERTLDDFWRSVNERERLMPEEVWDGTPTDGSVNVDHYLYGTKKNPR